MYTTDKSKFSKYKPMDNIKLNGVNSPGEVNLFDIIDIILNAGINPDGPDGVLDCQGDYVKF